MSKSDLAESFMTLRRDCMWLQTCFNTFETLFESGPETLGILGRSAPRFFKEVNLIFLEYFILQVCRITDPPASGRDKRENLTLKNINNALVREGLMTASIAECSKRVHEYRSLVELARNRVISHADKETLLTTVETEPHTRSDLEDFMSALHSYCDLVSEAVGVDPVDFKYTGAEGDAEALVSCLRAGLESKAM